MTSRNHDAAATAPEGAVADPREAEARLDAFIANLPGFVFQRVMTPDGVIRYPWISDSVEALLGFSAASLDVNSQGCLHVVHWADRDPHVEEIRRSALALDTCHDQFRAITATGEVRWLHGRSQPRRLADGTVRWDGVVVDVTEGRRAELRLDMLMDHADDSILVLDAQGNMDSVNVAAERLFGWAAADMIGQPFAVLLSPDLRHPDILDPQDSTTAGLVGGGPRDLTGLRKDGTTFPLELSTSEVRLEGRRLFVGIGRDITKRRATEAALRETEQRLRAIAANMPGMVFQRVLHPDGSIAFSYVSESCRNVMGLGADELTANPNRFLAMLPMEERQAFLAGLGRSAKAMEPFDEEMSVVGADFRRRWLRGQSRPTRRDNGDVVWDGVMLDVTERKTAEQRLSFLAYHDPLTRLPNRPAFLERFAAAAGEARRDGSLLAVISMGIDRFGIINATMGHAIGDQVLMAAADLIRAGINPNDVIARSSGDRFLLLLTGYAVKRELQDALERLHQTAQATVSVAGQDFDISATLGVSFFPRDGEDAETLIKNADAALQRAKEQGPSTLQLFTKDMSTQASTIFQRLKTMTIQTGLSAGSRIIPQAFRV